MPALRNALAKTTRVYFDGLLAGWNALYPRSVGELVGTRYGRLSARILAATKHRNKIFHGQLTAQGLSPQELIAFVTDIRTRCEALGGGAQSEVGYDGCGGNSFRKAANAAALCAKYKVSLANPDEYMQFIRAHMEGPVAQQALAVDGALG